MGSFLSINHNSILMRMTVTGRSSVAQTNIRYRPKADISAGSFFPGYEEKVLVTFNVSGAAQLNPYRYIPRRLSHQ